MNKITTMTTMPSDLTTLATLINQTHDGARDAATTALEYAHECGKLLIEAKGKVHHGGWRRWLAENTTVSERTAQGYMQLAREWDRLAAANPQRVADFSLRKALHFVAAQRQVEIATAPKPATVVYTDRDGTQHWGADALEALDDDDDGDDAEGPVVEFLPPELAERLQKLEADQETLLAALHDEERLIEERAQRWLEAATAALWDDARPQLDALEQELTALRKTGCNLATQHFYSFIEQMEAQMAAREEANA